ncbi:MAG: hypothetical protein M3011_00900 [Actinomycetota bacterium]|nr:hypothetical protein [Actinomycetota bacterium]
MVLVSFVLVVVAAITLVIGLLQSGLAIIYVSIACSVLAGIVLATAVLRGRRPHPPEHRWGHRRSRVRAQEPARGPRLPAGREPPRCSGQLRVTPRQ